MKKTQYSIILGSVVKFTIYIEREREISLTVTKRYMYPNDKHENQCFT